MFQISAGNKAVLKFKTIFLSKLIEGSSYGTLNSYYYFDLQAEMLQTVEILFHKQIGVVIQFYSHFALAYVPICWMVCKLKQ